MLQNQLCRGIQKARVADRLPAVLLFALPRVTVPSAILLYKLVVIVVDSLL